MQYRLLDGAGSMRPPAIAGVARTFSFNSLAATCSNFGPTFRMYVRPASLVTYSLSPTRTGELVTSPLRAARTRPPCPASCRSRSPPRRRSPRTGGRRVQGRRDVGDALLGPPGDVRLRHVARTVRPDGQDFALREPAGREYPTCPTWPPSAGHLGRAFTRPQLLAGVRVVALRCPGAGDDQLRPAGQHGDDWSAITAVAARDRGGRSSTPILPLARSRAARNDPFMLSARTISRFL